MGSSKLVIVIAVVLSLGYVVLTAVSPAYERTAATIMLALIAAFLAGIYEELRRANNKS